jgi:Mg2+ and Co2+ transporter CorA
MADDDSIKLKIDVGVLKEQVSTIMSLCSKMDAIIEKLSEQHERHIVKVYDDMEDRRLETETDIKEIHDRIDTVLEKVQESERRLMQELKSLKQDITEHNKKEKESLDQLLQWKWMVAGGILVVSWLLSHVNFDTIRGVLIK